MTDRTTCTDLADLEETDLRAILAAAAEELARRLSEPIRASAEDEWRSSP